MSFLSPVCTKIKAIDNIQSPSFPISKHDIVTFTPSSARTKEHINVTLQKCSTKKYENIISLEDNLTLLEEANSTYKLSYFSLLDDANVGTIYIDLTKKSIS